MSNPEKHRRNDLVEWLEEEDSSAPARPRGPRVVGARAKAPAPRKVRRAAQNGTTQKVEAALVREPAPPPKIEPRQSQANSPDHLRKRQRIFNLRAPHSTNPGKTSSGPR